MHTGDIAAFVLLVLSCLGAGGIALHRWHREFADLPAWLLFSLQYFLGQGIVAIVLLLLALAGLFFKNIILAGLLLTAMPALWLMCRSRTEFGICIGRAAACFRQTPLGWKILVVMAVGLYLYGVSTIGAMPAGDAVAFYLAICKTTVYAHKLVLLPGYESFALSVGLYAEILLAALMELGVPALTVRMFSWVNYFPTLVLLWGLARLAGLSRRGSLISLCIALTSSAALILWGGGKTDLYAVGPGFAACVMALLAWNSRTRMSATLLSGIFCGYAIVLKLSLLAVLLPTVLLILEWSAWIDLFKSLRQRTHAQSMTIIRRGASNLAVFGVGCLMMILPHVVKNLWLGGSALGFGDAQTMFYSHETIRRLLLTYPLALTFGRYWAQYGNLSPLVIAFLPLLYFLPVPASWSDSRLAALTIGTSVGLLLWMAFMPSVFMPRYILVSLLMLGIPAGAAAAYFSRVGTVPELAVLGAAMLTIVFTPSQVNSWEPEFSWSSTIVRFKNPSNDCAIAAGVQNYCNAHEAINEAVRGSSRKANRVLVFSWYRLWLQSELLLSANGPEDTKEIEYAADPWQVLRSRDFGFVLLDSSYSQTKVLTQHMPPAGTLRELYKDSDLAAYEILQ